ncbi:hypothetical protein CHUAL_001642 [Chamberlinius hualienensis]
MDLLNCNISCCLSDKDEQLLLEVDTNNSSTNLYMSHPSLGVDLREAICRIQQTLKIHEENVEYLCAHKIRDIKEKPCAFVPSLPFVLQWNDGGPIH